MILFQFDSEMIKSWKRNKLYFQCSYISWLVETVLEFSEDIFIYMIGGRTFVLKTLLFVISISPEHLTLDRRRKFKLLLTILSIQVLHILTTLSCLDVTSLYKPVKPVMLVTSLRRQMGPLVSVWHRFPFFFLFFFWLEQAGWACFWFVCLLLVFVFCDF